VEKLKIIKDQIWNEWPEKSFSKEWKKISDVEYGETIIRFTPGFGYGYKNSSRNRFRFEHGLVRPYGGVNEYEDCATFVEAVINQPYALGITIGLNQDSRYLEKLNYLYKEGYISRSEYKKVMSIAKHPEEYWLK